MSENQTNGQLQEEVQDINILKKVRIEKFEELKKNNKNPYEITKFDVTAKNAVIREKFEEMENQTVVIAGRIMSWRDMGKANFIDVRDDTDRMQVYIRMNDIGEDVFAEFKKWDIGDIIGVEGFVFRTKKGEISVHAQKITLLSKSLLPLPEKWHGLKDQDMRYRQRYVDLICNPEVRILS